MSIVHLSIYTYFLKEKNEFLTTLESLENETTNRICDVTFSLRVGAENKFQYSFACQVYKFYNLLTIILCFDSVELSNSYSAFLCK